MYIDMNRSRAATRRVTANLPSALLDDSCRIAQRGITDTLVLGLELVRRRKSLALAKKLRGNLKLDIDLEVSRERSRRR